MYKIGKCLVFKGIWCFQIILEKADVKLEETREVQKHFLYDIAKYTWLANHWMGNTHNFLLIFSHSICKCWYSIQKSFEHTCMYFFSMTKWMLVYVYSVMLVSTICNIILIKFECAFWTHNINMLEYIATLFWRTFMNSYFSTSNDTWYIIQFYHWSCICDM